MKHNNYDIPQNELRIEVINENHLDCIKTFDTKNKELKQFLVDDALENLKK